MFSIIFQNLEKILFSILIIGTKVIKYGTRNKVKTEIRKK